MIAIIKQSMREKLFWLMVSICAALAWADATRSRHQRQLQSIEITEGPVGIVLPVHQGGEQ